MKKAFLLASVLFISVISTACINNFAVQELNNKAKDFMDKGDYASAIERLKSSADLDGNVFETQYNLAVAYTKAEDYPNAVKTYNDAIKLNPDFADAYYSLAVAEENLAKDIISGEVKVNEDGSVEKVVSDNDEPDEKKSNELSGITKSTLVNVINSSIENYNIYLEKAPSAEDTEDVESSIKGLEELLKSYDK
jgi:tetratricopeptide (TPR) repeat protein